MTTPAALLGAFCTAMALLAIVRLGIEADWDRVDLGSTALVVGIALLSILWTVRIHSRLSGGAQFLLALAGGTSCCVGGWLLVRHWDGTGSDDVGPKGPRS